MCNSTTFCNPNKITKVHITMVGFVDDTTDQTNIFESNDAVSEQLIEQMQHNAQIWSDLLTPVMASRQQGPTTRNTGIFQSV
eukprot:12731190-Ditylum_brightwellii.AAC.1